MERRNILFIHMDQMHWQAMSAYGNPHVRTPGIDRIIEDGISFRASYSANPICCPARSSWYTGRMSVEHGVANNGKYKLREDLPDLGGWLRQHGDYKTVYAGKWHVSGRDTSDGFDVIFSGGVGKGEHSDPVTARSCMGFLQNYQGDKPFFLNAGFYNPHDCAYNAGALGGAGKFTFDTEIPESELPPIPKNFYSPYEGETRPKNLDQERFARYYMYVYYRWVEMADAEIGRLYDALMSSRFADNTVVIFSADHGNALGFHGQTSKSMMIESSWRVPMVIVDPERRRKGEVDNEHLSIGVDVSATICDYADVPPLPDMTIGKSLRPLVEESLTEPWHEYVVAENQQGPGKVGIRDATHKSIRYGVAGNPICIYNLETDPLEMNDLYGTPEGDAVWAKHENYFREYVNKIEVYEPTETPHPDTVMVYERYATWYNSLKEA